MAEKKIYMGSEGPFLYDDTDPINDADGDFSGETFKGLMTDGPIQTTQEPSEDNDLVRLKDLTVIAGDVDTLIDTIVCYEGNVITHDGYVIVY